MGVAVGRMRSMRMPVIRMSVVGRSMRVSVGVTVGVSVRLMIVGMAMVVTMSGMLVSITVIWCLIGLGRFQIVDGVVVIVVVVSAVRVAVMSAPMLKHEDAHQIYEKSHN